MSYNTIMKNTKETANKKQIKKIRRPKYVVNLVGACGELDATTRFALCKYDKHIDNFTNADISALKEYIKSLALSIVLNEMIQRDNITLIGCGIFYPFSTECLCGAEIAGAKIDLVEVKKPNIFKRFWNWLTRKK